MRAKASGFFARIWKEVNAVDVRYTLLSTFIISVDVLFSVSIA